MVGILVHGNNHFILSGPVPDEAVALALRGTGQSFKSVRQNLLLSASGRFGQKNFERIWNGRWLSQVTENLERLCIFRKCPAHNCMRSASPAFHAVSCIAPMTKTNTKTGAKSIRFLGKKVTFVQDAVAVSLRIWTRASRTSMNAAF